jgi:hypothetical protein
MTKILLAVAAVLSLFAGPAHAQIVCVVVSGTPDGFLALRKAPDAKSKMIAALQEGYQLSYNINDQFLEEDEYPRYKYWTKWKHVRAWLYEEAEPTTGWVHGKYFKTTECTKNTTAVFDEIPAIPVPASKYPSWLGLDK